MKNPARISGHDELKWAKSSLGYAIYCEVKRPKVYNNIYRNSIMNKTSVYLMLILLAIIFVSVLISEVLDPSRLLQVEGLVAEKGTALRTDLKMAMDDYPQKPGEGIQDLQKIQSKLLSGMYPDIQNDVRTKITSYLPNMISAEEQLAKNNIAPVEIKNTIDKIVNQNAPPIKFGSAPPKFQPPAFANPKPNFPPPTPVPPPPKK